MLDINLLREEISGRGFDWEAGETEVSGRLTAGDGTALLGLSMTREESTGQVATALSRARSMSITAPPPYVNWRNHNGGNYVSPVKDQVDCGSCVAFASCASLEARVAVRDEAPGDYLDLSEAHLFFCGAGQACGTGWNFRPAMLQCQSVGVGDEADWPYRPINQPCQSIPSRVKISGWTEEARMADRKTAIAEGGPALAGMKVYEDFSYYQGGIYRHTVGAFTGLHAVCVVGYDDAQRCWIAKNSWGTGWGEDGFFRIAYGECGFDSDFVFFCPMPV